MWDLAVDESSGMVCDPEYLAECYVEEIARRRGCRTTFLEMLALTASRQEPYCQVARKARIHPSPYRGRDQRGAIGGHQDAP
jgi:glutathione S-transferase